MKITYIHQHYSRLPAEGGLGRPWQFARRLAADGHEVTLVCGGRQSRTTLVEDVRIVHLRAPYANEASAPRRIVAFLMFVIRATVLTVRTPADVVLASSTPLTVAVPGMIGAFARRARFIFEVRDLWPSVPIELGALKNPVLRHLALALERLSYARADAVIALSEDMADGVRRVNPTVPVFVIPNASDFSLFSAGDASRDATRAAHGWDRDDIVLVYAGSFGRTYRLTWVVDLAAELREVGIRVVMYGSGGSTAALRDRAAERGLVPDEVLPGRIRRQDLARILEACDATISSLLRRPCLEANSLNKVFEAMAARKPIFFNHGGWLSDLVTSAGAGWVLDDDPSRAAKQIRELARDRDALVAAGGRNEQLGRTHFDRDQLYDAFRSVALG